MIRPLEQILNDHKQAADLSFTAPQVAILESIARAIVQAFRAGNKLLICGIGGSAADSQHIAAEFIARFMLERKSLPAIALTTDSSILTALANDYTYDYVFARQVQGLGQKGDILIGISTSGNSKNVLAAVEQAKSQGLLTISFTGRSGGKLKGMTDLCFAAQSDMTPHIQEIHITSLHAISEVVEAVLFGS